MTAENRENLVPLKLSILQIYTNLTINSYAEVEDSAAFKTSLIVSLDSEVIKDLLTNPLYISEEFGTDVYK